MSIKLETNPSNSSNELYILVLGETGTGKSTTINALASYLQYRSFEQACETSEFINLIPTQFALSNLDGEPTMVSHGSDPNECPNEMGASRTQAPKSYAFKTSCGKLIRVIDTPGIGDTSGIRRDQENFDKILHFLSKLKYLHGICILVKSNETRQNALFQYCISELFGRLHRNACRNVVFCFTYSRIDYYEAGDGFVNVRNFLNAELPNLKLVSGVNCYFIDNEAYRFLLAKKQGYPLTSKLLKSCKESWNKSVEQIQAMINHIGRLEPHSMVQTKQLNHTRQMLLNMAEPLAKLQANITENIQHIQAEEERLQNCATEQIDQVMQMLALEVNDLEQNDLYYPTTVCTEDKCVEVIIENGEQTIDYKTRCHERCTLSGVDTNSIAHKQLEYCESMWNGICKCGCHWQKHMHIRYMLTKVKRTIDLSSENDEKNTASQKLSIALRKMQSLDKEYNEELVIIKDVTSKFAYILNAYSNYSINQYIVPYLDMMIKEENRKMQSYINPKRATYDSLIQMRADHLELVEILTEAIRMRTRDVVRIEDIDQMKQNLISLKHSGKQFKQMIEVNIESKEKAFHHVEVLGSDLS